MKICVCGETRYKYIKEQLTQYGVITIVSCRKCGLIRDIKGYNYDFYYTDEAQICRPIDNISFQSRTLGWKRYLDFLYLFTRNKGTVLEIGCYDGSLLTALQEYGWTGIGIELNPTMAKLAISKGLNVINKPFNKVSLADDFFDLIVMSHVLEHMPDLEESLKHVERLLKPGGYLLVMAPNYGCRVMRMIRRSRWSQFLPGQHVWYFTKKTLKSSCELFGLKLLKFKTVTDLSAESKIFLGNIIKLMLICYMKFTDSGEELIGLFQKPL